MNRLQKAAILARLVGSLQDEGSWCGGTHIQKASYLLQQLAGVPMEMNFTLYKHGPYSFQLNDDLWALRADEFLALVVRDDRYGPCYRQGDLSTKLMQQFPKTLERYGKHIEFVSKFVGNANVSQLERWSTALFLRSTETKIHAPEAVAAKLVEIKPHIALDDAREAVQRMDAALLEARSLFA